MATEAEFEEFFANRARGLRRVAQLVVADWSAADEVTQTALTKVYANWRRVRLDTADAYARKAVVNCALTYVRKRRDTVPVMTPPRVGVEDRYERLDGEDLAQLLRDELPPAQRAVVALRFLDDLSVDETAEILGISSGAVKSQSSRGLAALRRILDKQSEELSHEAR